MFRAARMYGDPHEDNGQPHSSDAFYFIVDAADQVGRLAGFLSREQFNWVAERLGTPVLP